jgi:hypothetical protein
LAPAGGVDLQPDPLFHSQPQDVADFVGEFLRLEGAIGGDGETLDQVEMPQDVEQPADDGGP